MSCIHFKFKSSLEYEKLTFDGLHISLSDLREAIMKQKKIGSVNQYTLSVVDAQSKKEYSNEQEMIPRNTSVIISRVPLTNPARIPKAQRKDLSLSQPESVAVTTTSASSSLPPPLTSQRQLTAIELQETADLASANASEEDKVKAMMNQSSKDYDPSRYVTVPTFKGPSLASMKKVPPPANYVCHRCGKKGHWIQFCPTNGDPTFDNRTFRRSLGTPASQIISVSTNMPGVMLDRHGNLVMRAVDYEAIKAAQSKTKSEAPVKLELPSELTCPICKKLVKDAVIIQCCGGSFCYDCIQEFLCENEFTCPLCKETNVSPETLVPNKALRTAAKNFQMKESEQKSVSEARGYVPIVAPQPAVPNIYKRPTAVSSSTSGVSSVTVKPADASVEAQSTKVEEKREEASKSKEAETGLKGGADQLAVKAKEERAQTPESRGSPTPQQQKMKNKSEALLDRILSSSAKTTSKRTPPPAPATSAPVTATPPAPPTSAPTTTTAAPSVSSAPTQVSTTPSIPAGAPPVASIASTSRLAPTIVSAAGAGLTAPSVAAASALLSSGGILGLPRGPTSSALPGQGAVLTTSAVLPPVVITEPGAPQEDTAKLERIAAELLLSSAAAVKKSTSPPPLSAEEFYRQQKILKLFTKQSKKRTPSPFSATSDSRSSTPDSYLSYRSFSGSGSVSRSRSHSESSYSDDRSRSRSPIASHHSHRSKKKHRSHHKREKARQEKSKERGREKKSVHHSKRKRKRHLSPDVKESESKSKHSKSRFHQSRSPNRKKHRDNLISTTLAEGIVSPESSMGTPTPDMDVEAQDKLSSSQHKRYHRRRGKTKHRHRDRSEDRPVNTERGRSAETQRTLDNVQPDDSGERIEDGVKQIHPHEMELGTQTGDVSPKEEEDKLLTTNEKLQRGSQMIRSGSEEVADLAPAEINVTNLVPYQDSSTTEAECADEEKSWTTTGSNQRLAALVDNVADKTITDTELTMIESTSDLDHHGDDEPIKDTKVLEEGKAVEVATKGEEPNENELAEDSLMISLHVDDTIDGTATELLDADCPTMLKAGKEDGELTDSSNNEEEDNLFNSPDKAATCSASLSSHTTTGQRSSASDSIGSQPTVVTKTTAALAEDGHGKEKKDDVDLRVLLEQQKSSKPQKPVASAVTVASGSVGKFMSSSQQFQSSSVDSDWVSDDEEDRGINCSTTSSEELEKTRMLKTTLSSKHSSSSLKKHKRKHSANKSHRDKEREKKRKRRKEYKLSGESKKKARKEKDREKDREREREKKRKKHKKSDKYVKYSH